MKPGRRALGIAESYRGGDGATSTLAGVVVRADRTADDFVFGRCTVGGDDATASVIDLWDRLDREDVRYIFFAGIAPAWYNVLDIEVVAEKIDRPVISVTFEASDGLESGIMEAFDGEKRADRLKTYRSLPDRHRLDTGDEPLFVRSVGVSDEETVEIVSAYTHERRPEPLRVAKRLASRADAARRNGGSWSGHPRDRS